MTDEPKRYRGQRGPNKVRKERMKMVAIRLPQYVVDHYNNSSIAMRAALINAMGSKQERQEELSQEDYEAAYGALGQDTFFA
jgi:hypothetical protein